MAQRHACAALLAALAIALCTGPARSEDGLAAAKPKPASCQPANFRVVLDVGHTVAVPGAISAHGVPEYQFNLQLATAAKAALVAAGFDKTVLLITEKPPPLGLFERAFRANAMAADLFIAIHHDSVPDPMLQTWQYDGKELHYNDSYAGYAIFMSYGNADRADSLKFGQFLGAALQARGLGYTPHYTFALMANRRRELLDPDTGVYRYDQLVVLKETHMPAVLLEAGPIINRGEELALASPQRQALEGAAIAAAVEDFCAARANRPQDRQHERLVKRTLELRRINVTHAVR
jgi:N-acetylmuramoyl-L-alanine amidase